MAATTYPRKRQIEDQLSYLGATMNIVWKYFPSKTMDLDGERAVAHWTVADGSALFLDLTTREVEVWLSGVTTARRHAEAHERKLRELAQTRYNLAKSYTPGDKEPDGYAGQDMVELVLFGKVSE